MTSSTSDTARGLVVGRTRGRQVFHPLARPELLDLFVAAESMLVATGEAVPLRPVYGAAASITAASTPVLSR